MALIDERLGSGDFDDGPEGGSGKILFFVLFTGAEVASQDAAEDLALADPRAPLVINGYLRSKTSTSHQGGPLYYVDVEYKRGVPTKAPVSGGGSPAGQQTPGKDPNEHISRDVSFSTGGGTKRKYVSRYTVASFGRNGGTAPSMGKLIGVARGGGNLKVEGCEVFAPSTDFTITKRFQQLTVGWFRAMLSLVANTNDAPFFGLDTGEVLFKGCDGQFKDDDKQGFPWTVTGRFGFSPNLYWPKHASDLTLGASPNTIQINSGVRGWEYLWTQFATETVTIAGVPYMVELPLFAYVENVYPESDLTKLNLD